VLPGRIIYSRYVARCSQARARPLRPCGIAPDQAAYLGPPVAGGFFC
jgi:hypothetical protein